MLQSEAWLTAGYWAVDAKAETAMGGVWKKGPGASLFKSLNDVSTAASAIIQQFLHDWRDAQE